MGTTNLNAYAGDNPACGRLASIGVEVLLMANNILCYKSQREAQDMQTQTYLQHIYSICHNYSTFSNTSIIYM